MGATRRFRRRAKIFFSEIPDKFRRRKTEKPSVVRWPKKSHVVIGSVKETEYRGKTAFVAEFIPARAGTQLNPFPNTHQIPTAFEHASQQTIIGGLTRFGNIDSSVMLDTIYHGFRTIIEVTPGIKLFIRVQQRGKDTMTSRGISRSYTCRAVSVANKKTVYVTGNITMGFFSQKKRPKPKK